MHNHTNMKNRSCHTNHISITSCTVDFWLPSHSSLDTNWSPCCFKAIHHQESLWSLALAKTSLLTTHLTFRVNRLKDHGEICQHRSSCFLSNQEQSLKKKKNHSVEDLSKADNLGKVINQLWCYWESQVMTGSHDTGHYMLSERENRRIKGNCWLNTL